MAEIIHITDESFERAVLKSELPVVVDFWAPWCAPCRRLEPIFKEMASEYAGRVRFVKLNVDDNPEVGSRYGILSIPTVILFESGAPQETVLGAQSRGHYERVWQRWLSAAA